MADNLEKQIVANGAKELPYKEEEYKKFFDFYVLPTSERKKLGYKNLSDWSVKNGVHRNTISRWKNQSGFKKELFQQRMEWGSDQLGDVLEGWKKACIKGNVQAIELWLGYFTGWDKKFIKNDSQSDRLSKDDFLSLIKSLPQERQVFFYEQFADLVVEVQSTLRSEEMEVA